MLNLYCDKLKELSSIYFIGLPENVEKAKEEIEAHIAMRTCAQQTSIDDDFKNNGTEVGSPNTAINYTKPAFNPQ